MFNKMIVRKVMFPISSTTLLTASVAAAAAEDKKDEKKDEEKKELVRRKELSIYPVKKEDKPPAKEEKEEEKVKSESALISSAVKDVREAMWKMNKEVKDAADRVNQFIDTGRAHLRSTLDILAEKDNYPQRYAAISAGGLVGYVIAIRRGWFRRIIYTGIGAAAVETAVCPEDAKEYASEGFKVAKKYIIVAYHFINGVLRDYAGVQLPSLPGPLAVGSASAAEKDASTVPTSAALMPHTASAPSHISAGPIPLPPLDLPSSVSDKQG